MVDFLPKVKIEIVVPDDIVMYLCLPVSLLYRADGENRRICKILSLMSPALFVSVLAKKTTRLSDVPIRRPSLLVGSEPPPFNRVPRQRRCSPGAKPISGRQWRRSHAIQRPLAHLRAVFVGGYRRITNLRSRGLLRDDASQPVSDDRAGRQHINTG